MKQQTFWKLKLAIVCSILLAAFFISDQTSANISSVENLDVHEDEIFALVNDERQKFNLDILVWDAQLAEIARNYSTQMARENFFDHIDLQGADIVLRAKKSNLKHWSKLGENLFSIQGMRNFDAFAVRNWMKSPTHRQNILDADFNTAGIGIAKSAGGEVFITQIFIRR